MAVEEGLVVSGGELFCHFGDFGGFDQRLSNLNVVFPNQEGNVSEFVCNLPEESFLNEGQELGEFVFGLEILLKLNFFLILQTAIGLY